MTLDHQREFREQLRLKLVLQRAAQLARVYRLPEVKQLTLKRYADAGGSDVEKKRTMKAYMSMVSDSYRVLETAAGDAALEFQTRDELALQLQKRLRVTSQNTHELCSQLQTSLTCLDPAIDPQQRILERLVQATMVDKGVGALSEHMVHRATRLEFSRPEQFEQYLLAAVVAAKSCAAQISDFLSQYKGTLGTEGTGMSQAINLYIPRIEIALRFELGGRVASNYPNS